MFSIFLFIFYVFFPRRYGELTTFHIFTLLSKSFYIRIVIPCIIISDQHGIIMLFPRELNYFVNTERMVLNP